LFSPAGGGQELPLKEEIVNPEPPAEEQKKADKHESKTGMFLLGAGLAVSLLANVGLGWKLWRKPRLLTPGVNAILNAALDVLAEKSPTEASIVRNALTDALAIIENLNFGLRTATKIGEMNRQYERTIAHLVQWINAFQSGFRRILQGETISKREELEKIVNKDIESFKEVPPFFHSFPL
jgi:hypothetical protein